MRPTVLIVDDHDDFRELAATSSTQKGSRFGGAPDGSTAVVEAARLQPDVVLLDVQLPDVDGFAGAV